MTLAKRTLMILTALILLGKINLILKVWVSHLHLLQSFMKIKLTTLHISEMCMWILRCHHMSHYVTKLRLSDNNTFSVNAKMHSDSFSQHNWLIPAIIQIYTRNGFAKRSAFYHRNNEELLKNCRSTIQSISWKKDRMTAWKAMILLMINYPMHLKITAHITIKSLGFM